MTRKELMQLLATTPNGNGTISDDDPVVGIVYMSLDGGMTTIEGAREEYEPTEFTAYPVEGRGANLQLTMILRQPT